LFDGKHEWAPVDVMNFGFAGLQLDAIREGSQIPGRDSIVRNFAFAAKTQFLMEVANKRFYRAYTILNFSWEALEGMPERKWFTNQADSLVHSKELSYEFYQRGELEKRESSDKDGFQQHFAQMDTAYWHETIRDLNALADPHTPEGQMYQRELAFLSLAFYSISNRLIQSGNTDAAARYFVELYKYADPTNPEAWRFSAILNQKAGDAKQAEEDLAHSQALSAQGH
jgi:hypothetical protein